MIFIKSFSNPKIKQILHLRKRRERDHSNLFLIEGYREILRANEAKWKICSFFICPELFLGENEKTLIEEVEKNGASVFSCSEEIFRKVSFRDRPDGLLSIAMQQHNRIDELKKMQVKTPFFLVAESIEKPGNLGTILRSSDAAGCDAAIICDACTDIFNPNVVRASVGTLFTQPVIEATSEELLSFLKEQKIPILSATPHAQKEYTEVNLQGPIAIIVGTEQHGLSKKWLESCDLQVRIPMMGRGDSLNVGSATTILLYEALRQRRKLSDSL